VITLNVIIKPKKLSGEVIIPPSKSLSHRAIIAAGLASGKSEISNVLFSKDIKATIEAMRACGAVILEHENSLTIYGSKVMRKKCELNANESGSTIRFMIPIALVCSEKMTFKGENHLVNRPLDTYYEIFDKLNIKYNHPDNAYLPLETEGGLKAGTYEIRGDISSQFITGLLYALPMLDGDSKLVITTTLESKGYVDLTLDILSKFGIKIENNDYKEFYIKGNQNYQPFDYTVEGDYSQSAFFLVAGALGNDVKLLAMNEHSYQGDKKIIDDMCDFGCEIESHNDTLKCSVNHLSGAVIDFSQSPDLGPALTVLAAVANGKSEFINAARLRIKECDRITCMRVELEKMGAKITESPDGMQIIGVDKLNGAVIDSHNDHRVAMAIAMAATISTSDVKILNAGCVSKSFPHFWDVYKSLGGEIIYEE
jgi:3-phosphoshikimate 1-carboxyvinyltransferase